MTLMLSPFIKIGLIVLFSPLLLLLGIYMLVAMLVIAIYDLIHYGEFNFYLSDIYRGLLY